MKEKKEERVIRIDGKNCFVEVLDNSFPIDKVRLDFVAYDTAAEKGNRQTANIQIYVDVDKFLSFCEKVRFGGREYIKYCHEHTDYHEPLFQNMGGASATVLKKRGQSRKDGMGISKVLNVSASKKGYFLTAKSGPGEENEKGLIVPKYKEPEQKVSIALEHYDLIRLCRMVEMRYSAYLASEYICHPIEQREKPGEKKQESTKTPPPVKQKPEEIANEPTDSVSDLDLPF